MSYSGEVEDDPEKWCKSNRPPLLPPCRVCGGAASGYHYGVNTCEACKGFFRRSFTRSVEYRCSGRNDCPILPRKRNNCPACRMKKCLELGMSKTAIKTGRYSYERRTQYIEEVQELESQSIAGLGLKENSYSPEFMYSSPETAGFRNEGSYSPGNISIYTPPHSGNQLCSPNEQMSFNIHDKTDVHFDVTAVSGYKPNYRPGNISTAIKSEQSYQFGTNRKGTPAAKDYPEAVEKQQEHQAIIDALLTSQDLLIEDLDAFLDEVHMKKRQKDFYRRVASNNTADLQSSSTDLPLVNEATSSGSSSQHTGGDKNFAPPDYPGQSSGTDGTDDDHNTLANGIVNTTIAGQNSNTKRKTPLNPSPFPRSDFEVKRMEQMDKVAELMDSEFRNIISFIKAIPGWKSIDMEDQINLIKDGAAELWILGHCQCIDAELGVFTGEYDMTFQTAASMWTDVYVQSVYKTSVMFNKLKLSKEELVVLKTIVLTYPDRCALVSRDTVEKIQWRMIECLRYICTKNGVDFNKRFSTITDAMVIAREMTEKFKEIVKTVVCQWSLFEKFPLLKEFFNSF